jgi:hypothetical protein
MKGISAAHGFGSLPPRLSARALNNSTWLAGRVVTAGAVSAGRFKALHKKALAIKVM